MSTILQSLSANIIPLFYATKLNAYSTPPQKNTKNQKQK